MRLSLCKRRSRQPFGNDGVASVTMRQYQQLSGVRSGKGLFSGKKKLFLFERKGFGRGGEISSFLEELGAHFHFQKNSTLPLKWRFGDISYCKSIVVYCRISWKIKV